MLKSQDIEIWLQGHLQWHAIPAKFHENLKLVQKLLVGGHRDGKRAW
jgi:hypothetical protein